MGDRYRVHRSIDGGYTVHESDLATDIATGVAGVAGNIIGASISGLASVARQNRDKRMQAAINAMDRTIDAGNYEQLFELATDYSRHYQSDPGGPAYLSIALASTGRFNEALAAISRAKRLGLPQRETTMLRAATYREKGDLAQTLSEFTALTQYPDTKQDGYLGRAQALIELGDLDQALADVNQAIAISPNDYAYTIRGNVYHARGNQPKADEDYARAERLATARQATLVHQAEVRTVNNLAMKEKDRRNSFLTAYPESDSYGKLAS